MKLKELVRVLSSADTVVIQAYGARIYGGRLKDIDIAPADLETEVTMIRPYNDELIIGL